jgi:hypothetical protein
MRVTTTLGCLRVSRCEAHTDSRNPNGYGFRLQVTTLTNLFGGQPLGRNGSTWQLYASITTVLEFWGLHWFLFGCIQHSGRFGFSLWESHFGHEPQCLPSFLCWAGFGPAVRAANWNKSARRIDATAAIYHSIMWFQFASHGWYLCPA